LHVEGEKQEKVIINNFSELSDIKLTGMDQR